MPCGTEIHFGYVGKESVEKFLDTIGWKVVDYTSDNNDIISFKDFLKTCSEDSIELSDNNYMKNQLRIAYENVLTDLEWEFKIDNTKKSYLDLNRYYDVNSVYGHRTSVPFEAEVTYDPLEMNESIEDITFGVALSSRYYPCLLDMEDPHGALYTIVFTEEFSKKIDLCKKRIIEQIPEMKDAVIFIREKFY